MITVKDIYDEINSFAPYSIQESYDNSGLNVGNGDKKVKKILLALDVTNKVAQEAVENHYDLVISHHPVIFRGLKNLSQKNPAVILACGNVAAISMHTNFDSTENGMNDILAQKLGFEIIEGLHCEHNVNSGYVCSVKNITTAQELSAHCKKTLGCKVVRYSDCGKKISRVALCSGSGGEFLCDAVEKGCDVLLTGDVKHNVFIDGLNDDISVIDAGHYYTENIFFGYVEKKLSEKFPQLEISVAKNNDDVVMIEV